MKGTANSMSDVSFETLFMSSHRGDVDHLCPFGYLSLEIKQVV